MPLRTLSVTGDLLAETGGLARAVAGLRRVVRRVAGFDHALHAHEVGVHLALGVGAEEGRHRVAEGAGAADVGQPHVTRVPPSLGTDESSRHLRAARPSRVPSAI